MSDLIIIIPYFGTLQMIKTPVFVIAITQHSTIRSHARNNYSDVYCNDALLSFDSAKENGEENSLFLVPTRSKYFCLPVSLKKSIFHPLCFDIKNYPLSQKAHFRHHNVHVLSRELTSRLKLRNDQISF